MQGFEVPVEQCWKGHDDNHEGHATASGHKKRHPDKAFIQDNVDFGLYYKKNLPSLRNVGDNGEAKALCPFHDDVNPSLSVNLKTGKFCCHGCGAGGDILRFREMKEGISFGEALDRFTDEILDRGKVPAEMPDSTAAKGQTVYSYTDAQGALVFQMVRQVGPDGGKQFRQRQPDGQGGWKWNLEGVEPILYNLPEVMKADRVFVVEGEKDVETLRKAGLVATCNPSGAGKWRPAFSETLRDKEVIILPDNDEPGRKHAQKVAASVHSIAASVKLIKLPGLPDKGDITDWFANGNGPDALDVLIAVVSAWKPEQSTTETDWRIITGADLRAKSFENNPVIDGLLGQQETLLLCGTSGIGKSLHTLDIALALGHPNGNKLWDRFAIPERVKTIFFQSENSDAALKKRLDRMCGFDPALEEATSTHLVFPEFRGSSRIEGKLLDDKFIDMVIAMTLRAGAGLIVLDPLISYLGVDENHNSDVRNVLDRLTTVIDKTGASVLIVHHLAKQARGNVQGGRGAQAISDYASNILVMEHMDKDATNGFRLKVNHQKARNFEIEHPVFNLERGPNLRYSQIENAEDSEAKAKVEHVRAALEGLGGEVQKQAELKEALRTSQGWSDSEANRNILLAVKKDMLEEFRSGGKAKGYRLPSRQQGMPDLGNAA